MFIVVGVQSFEWLLQLLYLFRIMVSQMAVLQIDWKCKSKCKHKHFLKSTLLGQQKSYNANVSL